MNRSVPFHITWGTFLISLVVALTAAQALAGDRPLWLRYPSVSPDGSQIAFCYGGQIWRVPSSGGEAVPLTSGLFFAGHPVWSPDSSQIAFSSTRYGGSDIFIMPAGGGAIRRLTFHSSPDSPAAFSPDGSQVYFNSLRLGDATENFGGYHGAACSQLFSVPAAGGREKLLVPVPFQEMNPSGDGKFFLYTPNPSPENPWRKHEESAASRDVWVYNTTDKSHRQITFEPENDRNAVWSDQEGVFYYLSEKSGSFNVWRRSFKGKDAPVQITSHQTHPVRFLSCSNSGDLVYGYDGEVWRLPKGSGEAEAVEVTISQGSLLDGTFHSNVNQHASELVVSPDGTQLAIVARGEVFVVDAASGKTRRITTTPEHERNVSFSPDGRSLLYISHRDGDWDAFETTIATPGVNTFLTPGPLRETKVIATDSDVLSPAGSPDGKLIAFQEDYSGVRVFNRETKKTATVVKNKEMFSYKVDDLPFTWSPDGKWLAVTTGSAASNMEIRLVDPAGKKEPLNISRSGYLDANPEFGPDGKSVFFVSSRDGLKTANASDEQYDIYVTYLTQEAFDARGNPVTTAGGEEGKETPEWSPEPDGMRHRTARVTPFSSPGTTFMVLPDGASILLVTSSPTTGTVGYRMGIGGAGLKPVFTKKGNGFTLDAKGENCYFIHPGGIERVTLATGASRTLPLSADIEYDLRGEMAFLFDYFWKTTKDKFYRKDMQGVDWDHYKQEYAKYLPHISRWEDFAEMLAEMAGELNASHMGTQYNNPPASADSTASLGLYYDHGFEGPGMRITDYHRTGPAGRADSQLRPGATILAVDGEPITAEMDIYPLLNHKAGVPVQLTIKTADGEEVNETTTPISWVQALTIDAYKRWVDRCKETTDRLSKGRLGFIHISGMMTPQYKEFYGQLFGDEMKDKEGVIIDVRFNGGGHLSEQLIADLTGEYAGTLYDRNGNVLSQVPSTRWWKPSILLANTHSYSDASIFPHLYKAYGVGKFVGTPVPGTGTSVWQIKMFNGKFMYTLPELGRKDPEGNYYENTQDEPDILVHNTPDSIEEGRDLQLEAAVKALLEQIGSK